MRCPHVVHATAFVIVAGIFEIVLSKKFPPPPTTNAERAKVTVDPRKSHLLGGGSDKAVGHNRPMQEQPNSSPVTELLETPSWEEFYKGYIQRNKPVVFRGHTAKFQPAFKKWTDEYLVKNWGSKQFTAEVWKSEVRGGPSRDFSMRQFVKMMYQDKHSNEYYAVIDFDGDAKAQADYILPQPVRCKEILPQSLTLWMSAGGTASVMHRDDGENFLMLLDGTKEVMLVHQDYALNMYSHAAKNGGTSAVHQDSVDHVMFPNFKNVHWVKATLHAGDTLYIPHSWWHQVNSRGRNLAANFWWGHKHDYHWWDPHNTTEYNVHGYPETAITFDELKGRGPDTLPCTPLPDGETLDKSKFVDEGKYKEFIIKKRRELLKQRRKKQKSGGQEL